MMEAYDYEAERKHMESYLDDLDEDRRNEGAACCIAGAMTVLCVLVALSLITYIYF